MNTLDKQNQDLVPQIPEVTSCFYIHLAHKISILSSSFYLFPHLIVDRDPSQKLFLNLEKLCGTGAQHYTPLVTNLLS